MAVSKKTISQVFEIMAEEIGLEVSRRIIMRFVDEVLGSQAFREIIIELHRELERRHPRAPQAPFPPRAIT